jgi:hypothetical protein
MCKLVSHRYLTLPRSSACKPRHSTLPTFSHLSTIRIAFSPTERPDMEAFQLDLRHFGPTGAQFVTEVHIHAVCHTCKRSCSFHSFVCSA